jgi:hypothetical protein
MPHVLLDDPALVALLRRYLRTTGYRHGALFRASCLRRTTYPLPPADGGRPGLKTRR